MRLLGDIVLLWIELYSAIIAIFPQSGQVANPSPMDNKYKP